MKAKYLIGRDSDYCGVIGRKGSATNRTDERRPVSTICPVTLPVAKKMLKDFNKRPQSAGMKIFELKEVK